MAVQLRLSLLTGCVVGSCCHTSVLVPIPVCCHVICREENDFFFFSFFFFFYCYSFTTKQLWDTNAGHTLTDGNPLGCFFGNHSTAAAEIANVSPPQTHYCRKVAIYKNVEEGADLCCGGGDGGGSAGF